MKGQTQAVTAVLITGIVMGGIGTVYLWGVPMLEKRQVQQDVTATEEDVMSLYDNVVSVSQKGSGATATVVVDADRISLNTTENYIEIHNELDEPAKRGFTWSLLKGSSYQNISIGAGKYGIKGEDLPGVVAFKSTAGSGSSEITYRVEFRNLCATGTGELSKIELTSEGKPVASGQTRISLRNAGQETDNEVVMPEGACQGRTSRTKNLVQVAFE